MEVSWCEVDVSGFSYSDVSDDDDDDDDDKSFSSDNGDYTLHTVRTTGNLVCTIYNVV